MTDQENIKYQYTFNFEDGEQFVFPLELDPVTLELCSAAPDPPPDWALLDVNKCDACPLENSGREYCPVAANLASVVEAFASIISYATADVIFESQSRTVLNHGISMQEGISSLMGIIMVTSDCPDLDLLRPMVRFHLPFAKLTETIYRSSANYLVAQYFRHMQGKSPDWEMEKISAMYQRIEIINRNMCDRLRRATTQDAIINALIVLSASAQLMSYSFKGQLTDLAPLFQGLIDAD